MKTKVLISYAVTAQLICVFVFAYAKSRFSQDVAHLFQKRLYIEPYLNPIDPVECDMIFHQLTEDIFEHRIPVTPQDAVSTFKK